MFARTAKILTVERQRTVRAQVRQTFSKVQDLDRLNAPRRRPILIRRWQLDPVSGKPVCAWEVESPDLPRGLGITPIRSMPEPQLLCIAVLPRQIVGHSPLQRLAQRATQPRRRFIVQIGTVKPTCFGPSSRESRILVGSRRNS